MIAPTQPTLPPHPTTPLPTPPPTSPPNLIQFRSYQHDIHIYHVSLTLLPLHTIQRILRSHPLYIDTLSSFDPLHGAPQTPGDETPVGCLEAAYLPSVYHGAGSALGVRVPGKDGGRGRVEWVCFGGPMEGFLAGMRGARAMQATVKDECDGDGDRGGGDMKGDSGRVFDLVGFVQKGLVKRRVRGANPEHKAWHDSLRCAEKKRVSVRITWRKYGEELRSWREERGREKEKRRRRVLMVREKDKAMVVVGGEEVGS